MRLSNVFWLPQSAFLQLCAMFKNCQYILVCICGFAVYAAPAQAIEIPIENEAEYATLIDAVRAAEYTRQQYLETDANPRAIASVVGLWAFAEGNPLATPEQLAEFVTRFDFGLATAVPADPVLIRMGSVTAALNSTLIESDGLLAGTDTRVGLRAMNLLGIQLPGLDNYEESRLRMARYDLAAVRDLINRSETADALTAVLAGVNPTGVRVEGLATTGAAYLESVGYAPMLGAVDPLQVAVNAGLVNLPTYTEFVMIRDVDGAHLALEDTVFAQIDVVQASAAAILSGVGTVEVPPNLVKDSVDLFRWASDPGSFNHASALAELQARQQAIINSIRSTSDNRVAIFARTLLLQQSSYPAVKQIATSTRSFAGLQLQVNNDLAVAQESIAVAGSILGIAAGLKSGDPWGAMQSMTDLFSGSIGLADALGDGPPSPEEQIFEQIVELRQQVEDLRAGMNARFNVVDAKLDSVFQTMVAGFDALGDQIGALQDSVDDLTAAVAEVRTTLERVEAALFGFAEDVLLFDLSVQTNLVLDYRQNTGLDLSYGEDNPSFVVAASFFHTFATTDIGAGGNFITYCFLILWQCPERIIKL